jgi:hypothetical protein
MKTLFSLSLLLFKWEWKKKKKKFNVERVEVRRFRR